MGKSLLKFTKKTKKKHNKIIALAKSKLSDIETLLSSALNDSKISHKEFTSIITETPELPSIKELTRESSLERSTKEKLTTL